MPLNAAPGLIFDVPGAARGVRSRDLKGEKFGWTDLKIVHEFGETSPYKGHAVAYVDHPDDLARLGKTMGHCAGTHYVWACEERIWAFFTIITTDDQRPHTTLHAKQLKWVGKNHPRDACPSAFVRSGEVTCQDCNGYGALDKKGQPTDRYAGAGSVIICTKCKGRGYHPPEVAKDALPYPRASSGGYPTFADVAAAFKDVGKKYEEGKWAPVSGMGSRSYEIPKDYKERIANFEGTFGRNLIQGCPDGVSKESWGTYEKAVAALKKEFDKGNGAVQIVGRTFKFDSKEWYVLSFSGRGDGRTSNTAYRGMLHEFFIEGNKKKRKEANAE